MLFIVAVSMFFNLCAANNPPVGHLKPFGSHRKPTQVTPELNYVPQPEEFFNNFVIPRKSVVFRGAAIRSQAYQLWTEEYLKKKHGDVILRMEARDEADGRVPVTELGVGRGRLRHFINNYQHMNAYVISSIPRQMESDVTIPPCLRCGYFAQKIQEVHLFMTGKGGQTKLHRDPFSNIHCVYNGTKDWILVDDNYKHFTHQSRSSRYEFGGFSLINVDAVDLLKFPNISSIRYSLVTLKAGDCIYIPSGYWHQVRVNGIFNVAVSIWFSAYYSYLSPDWSDCYMTSFDYQPMNQLHVIRHYDVEGELTQGQMDIYMMKMILMTYVDDVGIIDVKGFCREMINSKFSTKIAQELRRNFTDFVMKSRDVITGDDVMSMSVEDLLKLQEILDPNDISNREDFEFGYIDIDNLMSLLDSLLLSSQGSVTRDQLRHNYVTILGGTERVADMIFAMICDGDVILWKNMEEKRNKLMEIFSPLLQHDPTIERLWFKHLKKLNIKVH